MSAALLLGWASLIFFASSQPYTDQDLRPMLGDFNLAWVERFFGWVSFTYSSSVISVETRGAAGFVEFFIRKGTHVVVFFVLGFLVMVLLGFTRMRLRTSAVLAFICVALFAAIDEYRHLIHPGRTGLIEDVILDCIGGAMGIAVVVFWQRHRQRKEGA